MSKFGFFYPENGERFLSMSFDSAQEAIDWWRDRRSMWVSIKAGSKDQAAFMQPNTGHIVVVREVENE